MFSGDAPITIIILILTVGVSLFAMYKSLELYEQLLLSPWRIVHYKEWHRFVTSGFVHADLVHLAFNMITFYYFATGLERVLGGFDFLIVYFGALALSDVSTVLKRKDDPDYRAVGASGAVSGVLLGFILFAPTASIRIMFFPIGIPAPLFALLFIAYSYFGGRYSRDNVNHEAHLWGALSGVLLTIMLEPRVVAYFISQVFG